MDERQAARQPIRIDLSGPARPATQVPVSRGRPVVVRDSPSPLSAALAQAPARTGQALSAVLGPLPRILSEPGVLRGLAAAVTPASEPARAQPRAQQSVQQALEVGRSAPPTITPQDRLLAYVDNILRGPATIREVQAAAGLIPQQGKPPSGRDQAVGTASSIADATYTAELQKAQTIDDQATQDAEIQKATDRYFNRVATLSGANVGNLSLTDLVE